MKNLMLEIQQLHDVINAGHRNCSCLDRHLIDEPGNSLIQPLVQTPLLYREADEEIVQCLMQMGMQLQCHQALDSLLSRIGSAPIIADKGMQNSYIYDIQERKRLRETTRHLANVLIAKGTKSGFHHYIKWALGLAFSN